MFKKATKQQAKLRMSIAGPSGSGKTYTALAIAQHFGKVAVIDTENASASKYADEFEFDVLEMDAPYHPARFVEAITEASKAGYDVVIVDSLSPAWNGAGGLLELVDQFAKRMKTTNTFAAWKDATPIQNRLAEAIVRSKIHIIATMRSKTEYVLETENGKTIPRKVGMAPIQRDGFEYEFDVIGELNHDHDLIVTKTRCRALDGGIFNKAGGDVAQILDTWLGSGAIPADKTKTGWASPSDFLFHLYEEFKLSEDNAKELLRDLGFTGFKKNGEFLAQSLEMYAAVKSELKQQTQAAEQSTFAPSDQPGALDMENN